MMKIRMRWLLAVLTLPSMAGKRAALKMVFAPSKLLRQIEESFARLAEMAGGPAKLKTILEKSQERR